MGCRQLADLSLLTERKTVKVRRTINMSLLRSEENLRSQNLARKPRSRRFVAQRNPLEIFSPTSKIGTRRNLANEDPKNRWHVWKVCHGWTVFNPNGPKIIPLMAEFGYTVATARQITRRKGLDQLV